MSGSARVVPPAGVWMAGGVLASPESTGATGIKFVGVLVGLALLVAAIRALFGRKR